MGSAGSAPRAHTGAGAGGEAAASAARVSSAPKRGCGLAWRAGQEGGRRGWRGLRGRGRKSGPARCGMGMRATPPRGTAMAVAARGSRDPRGGASLARLTDRGGRCHSHGSPALHRGAVTPGTNPASAGVWANRGTGIPGRVQQPSSPMLRIYSRGAPQNIWFSVPASNHWLRQSPSVRNHHHPGKGILELEMFADLPKSPRLPPTVF